MTKQEIYTLIAKNVPNPNYLMLGFKRPLRLTPTTHGKPINKLYNSNGAYLFVRYNNVKSCEVSNIVWEMSKLEIICDYI